GCYLRLLYSMWAPGPQPPHEPVPPLPPPVGNEPGSRAFAGHGSPAPARWGPGSASNVVVQEELVGNRPDVHLVELPRPLVPQPGVQQVPGEHVAFQQELVVRLERVERSGQ